MVEIVPLHQPSTAAEILAAYESKGNASVEVAELQISVADWRRIARQVAKDLGRPVRTQANEWLVVAWLTDWPSGDVEEQKSLANMREAAGAVGRLSRAMRSTDFQQE